MSSIAEYRRVLEIEGRLDLMERRLKDMDAVLATMAALCTELEVRLENQRPQQQARR